MLYAEDFNNIVTGKELKYHDSAGHKCVHALGAELHRGVQRVVKHDSRAVSTNEYVDLDDDAGTLEGQPHSVRHAVFDDDGARLGFASYYIDTLCC